MNEQQRGHGECSHRIAKMVAAIEPSTIRTVPKKQMGRKVNISAVPAFVNDMLTVGHQHWRRSGGWRVGLATTTPCVRIRRWAMPRLGSCITRPNRMGTSRRPGAGSSDRGAPGQPSVRPFDPDGSQGLTPDWTPEPRSSVIVETQSNENKRN